MSGVTSVIAGIAPSRQRTSARGQHILSVSPLTQDHAALRHILYQSPWRIVSARTCRQAMTFLRRRPTSAVFCERDLPDGTWRDLLNRIANIDEPPLMIVTSSLADDRLWAEVLNLGGYDVLAKPFHEEEVRHVVASLGNRIVRREACAAGTAW